MNSLSDIVNNECFESLSSSKEKRSSKELICSEDIFEEYLKRRKQL